MIHVNLLKKKIICLIFIFLSFNFFLHSFSSFDKPNDIYPEVVLPSTLSLSGIYCTYQNQSLFSNPSLFAFNEEKTSLFSFNFKLDTLSYSFFKYIGEKDSINQYFSILSNAKTLYSNASITGPISFSFLGKNFGFGLFNTTRAIANLSSISSVFALLGEDILIKGGYGASIYEKGGHVISLGVNMKGFFQTYAYLKGTLLGSSYSFYNNGFESAPIVFQAGFGLDIGFIYKWKNKFSLGFTCNDLYSPFLVTYYENYHTFLKSKQSENAKYKTFIPKFNIGCNFEIFSKGCFNNISSLTFYVDLKDIFSFIPSIRRNYFLNFAFGGELIFHQVLFVRLGIMELYPYFGVGLDFSYFNLDFGIYGKELALNAWSRPLVNIEIGIRFDI